MVRMPVRISLVIACVAVFTFGIAGCSHGGSTAGQSAAAQPDPHMQQVQSAEDIGRAADAAKTAKARAAAAAGHS